MSKKSIYDKEIELFEGISTSLAECVPTEVTIEELLQNCAPMENEIFNFSLEPFTQTSNDLVILQTNENYQQKTNSDCEVMNFDLANQTQKSAAENLASTTTSNSNSNMTEILNADFSNLLSTTTKAMELAFIVQPQSSIRFRPITDPNTHGVIKGETSISASSYCYPKIQLKNFESNKQTWQYLAVFDSYIKGDAIEDASDIPILSPHLFGHKKPRVYGSKGAEKKYDLIREPIKVEMLETTPGVYECCFEDYFVIKNKDINQAEKAANAVLEKYKNYKRLGLDLPNLNFVENLENFMLSKKEEIKKSNNSICLGVSIYERKITPTGIASLHCLGPLLSNPIENADKSIQIIRLCNTSGFVNVSKMITVLVVGITNCLKNKLNIIMEENDGDWSARVENKHLEFHQNAAITFQLPNYAGKNIDGNQIHCKIYLERDDGVRSDGLTFVYRSAVEPTRKKPCKIIEAKVHGVSMRQFHGFKSHGDSIEYDTDSVREIPRREVAQVIQKVFTEPIEFGIEKLVRFLKTENFQAYESKFGNTIFFDAIEHDKFVYMQQYIERSQLKELINNWGTNDFGDNLLHHACRLGKSRFIRPLIGMNCKIWQQNNAEKTPLHLVIENGDHPMIAQWMDLIKHPDEYENFKPDFKRTLSIYDRQGYTVLHRAVLNDQRQLVQAIMEFYRNMKMDLNRYEVLGNGYTIMHLAAAAANLKNMLELILKFDEETLYQEDYAGLNAFEAFAESFSFLNI